MTRPSRLDEASVAQALVQLAAWHVSADGLGIERTFVFEDFVQAFGFMTRMAFVSEAMDHHPEWRNVYRRVEVRLTTHDSGGITALDLDWARKADAQFKRESAAS